MGLGDIHKGRPRREGAWGSSKPDIVREVMWIKYCRSSTNADKGGRGSKIPKKIADVLYVYSLRWAEQNERAAGGGDRA